MSNDALSQIKTILNPAKNSDWAWCYCFVPAFLAYVMVLMQFINEKPITGSSIMNKPEFNKIFSNSRIEIIAQDLLWTEGPLWIEGEGSYLIFSDTKKNKIMRWEDGKI